ncbi:TPA: hypothetical protein DEW05_04870 [Candidatus Saccharibacteria bacterium]|nr:hypothetical protein [Candidatus Saccharibacteria bacterium]
MQDRRSVKLLLHNNQGEFLVLRRSDTHPTMPRAFDLPGGDVEPGETDLVALDREISEEIGLVFNTEDAVHIGYDAEYEPGEGLMTRVLYMLKIETSRPLVRLSWEHESFDWVDKETLRGFEPPFQVLVRTALDFYL